MKKLGFWTFAVVFLLSTQGVRASFNDYSSESSRYSEAYELEHSMRVRRIRDITQYSFKDEELLMHIFTHHSLQGNSRFRQLEFIGDKVINAVIALQTFDIDKRVEDLNNTVKSKVSNKNLSKVSASLDLPAVKANPSCSIDTLAADSFEALVGAIQLDSKGNEFEISPEAAYFVISSLCSKQTAKKLSKQPHLLASSVIIEKYSNKYISELSPNDLNSELQMLKNKLAKGVPPQESLSILLIIQLFEQEQNHRKLLKRIEEKYKQKTLKAVVHEEQYRFQQDQRRLSEIFSERQALSRLQQTISSRDSTIAQLRAEISRLRHELSVVEDRYSSLRNAGVFGRIFRRN